MSQIAVHCVSFQIKNEKVTTIFQGSIVSRKEVKIAFLNIFATHAPAFNTRILTKNDHISLSIAIRKSQMFVLRTWCNQYYFNHIFNLQKLETILCRAAEETGYKGPTNLDDIPHVSPDEITEYLLAFNELPEKLTVKQIVSLAAVIAAENMPAIAEGYLNISDVTIADLQKGCKGHAEALNRAILRNWTYTNSENQVQVGI